MHKYIANGMFGSYQLNTIEEARAVLKFAFEQNQKSEERVYLVECRAIFGNKYVPVSVPFDTKQIPIADEYAAFNMNTGQYVVYKTFEEAKQDIEAQRQQRVEELMASYSITMQHTDPDTGEESWVVIETLGEPNE